MGTEQIMKNQDLEQIESDTDLGKTITRLTDRQQAVIEGVIMAMQMIQTEKAG